MMLELPVQIDGALLGWTIAALMGPQVLLRLLAGIYAVVHPDAKRRHDARTVLDAVLRPQRFEQKR